MEVQKFTKLDEIDVLRSTPSIIKVKVLKVWSLKDNNNANEDFRIEMVFMDESGNLMQSTVFRQDIFRFKRYLNENATLTIVNPSLGSNSSNYKVIDCPNKLVLNSSTHVNPCDKFDGPTFGFKLYSFKSVIDKEIPLKATIDIIGHVVHVFKDNNSNLRDVKKMQEKPYVSNSYGSDVTRVFINDSIFEIDDYKSRPIPVKLMSTLDEEFLKATSFYNISEICTILQPKSIIVLGTIKALCPESEWYYLGCNNCNRKLIVNVIEGDDVYECKNQRCNTLGVTPTPRYKIKLRVQDGTGVVSLTLFDRDAKLIINKTASELLAIKDKVENAADTGFSIELNCLLEKKFAFKVEVADFNFRNNVEPSESGSITFGNSLPDYQSTSSGSFKISGNGDNKTPISDRLDVDEVSEIKLSSSDSDDKLKRKLADVFDGDGQFGFSSTKSKTSDLQDVCEMMYYPIFVVFNQPLMEDMKITRVLRDDHVVCYLPFLLRGRSYANWVVSLVDGSRWTLVFKSLRSTTPGYAFVDEWPNIAKHVNLQVKDYVVLEPIEKNHLRLYVFDSRGVERTQFDQQNIIPVHSANVDILTIEDDESYDVADLEVDGVRVNHHHVSNNFVEVVISDRLRLPVQFARDNGLDVETDLISPYFIMSTSFLMLIEDPNFPIQEIPKEFILQNSLRFQGLPQTTEIEHYKGSLIVELKRQEKTVCLADGVTDLMCSLKISPYQRIIFVLFEDESKWLPRTPSNKAISTGHRQAFVLYNHNKMNDKLVVSKKNIESQFQDKLQIGLVQDLCFRDGDVLWLKYVNKSTIDLRVYEKNGNLSREPLSDVSNTTQPNNVQNVYSNPPSTCFSNGYSSSIYHYNQYDDTSTQLGSFYSSNRKQRKEIVDGKREKFKQSLNKASQTRPSSSSCVISSNIIPNPTSNVSGSVSNYINSESTSSKRRVGRPRRTTNTTPIPMQQLNDFEFVVDVFKGISIDYVDHGDQSFKCESCNACLWELESRRGKRTSADTTFSLCCRNGNVKLPDLKQPHETYVKLFRGEDPISKYFLKNIRRFNYMFFFTSMGGKIDNSINRGNTPYTFRLGGENYHSIGSLLPLDGNKPQFSQLYIYDKENEISNRQRVFGQSSSDTDIYENYIINYLKEMLDSQNPLVQIDFKLRIVGTRKYDARTYNLPTASEVAALIVGDIGDAMDKRDIIVNSRSGGLRRVSELHPSYTPLQFPLLYPFGEDGYKVDIAHRNVDPSCTGARKKCTMREFFAYRLQDRPN
ncbi:uncharacterized protein LOC143552507 [Bidens hawaiensis]|uniref:uncharacterized protein LOC143552507 n=1 Tax=Bidens hawaiensis TaxID=980011 RepID=UPI00404A5DB6